MYNTLQVVGQHILHNRFVVYSNTQVNISQSMGQTGCLIWQWLSVFPAHLEGGEGGGRGEGREEGGGRGGRRGISGCQQNNYDYDTTELCVHYSAAVNAPLPLPPSPPPLLPSPLPTHSPCQFLQGSSLV